VKGSRRGPIADVLRQIGPMTKPEIAEALGWPLATVSYTIESARWLLPGQVFRVVAYRPVRGRRAMDLSVFAAEAGKDKQRKPYDPAQRKRESDARSRAKHRVVTNAKFAARRAAERGTPVVVNPWMQLADKSIRARMGTVANNSSMKEAA
jgi:hypothetical protein